MTGAADGFLAELSEDECWELLSLRTVARIAFVDTDGVQQLLPVNFVVVDHDVYVRTAHGSTLGALAAGHDAVALQTDHVEDLYQLAWSVTATGTMTEESDADAIDRLLAVGGPSPWAPGERDVHLVLKPYKIAGRRVRQS